MIVFSWKGGLEGDVIWCFSLGVFWCFKVICQILIGDCKSGVLRIGLIDGFLF
jgi:hypothetical protein